MLRILLAEDNEMNSDMLIRRLQRQGWEVVLATTGTEAVRLAGEIKPDVVVMDMSLPEMDGWTATRILRDHPLTSALPVIALTAHAMSGDRERALAAGCNVFATKPVDFAGLTSQILNLTSRKAELWQ